MESNISNKIGHRQSGQGMYIVILFLMKFKFKKIIPAT